MSDILNNDVDPIETRDWLQAIESVIREEGVGFLTRSAADLFYRPVHDTGFYRLHLVYALCHFSWCAS